MMRIHRRHSQGFTIVELMIATVIFSIILLICLMGIMRITSMYYKGVNTARTQQTVRSVIDDVSQSIQFSGSTIIDTSGGETHYGPGPTDSPTAFYSMCIGDKRYSYAFDAERVANHTSNNAAKKQLVHALWVDKPAGGCADASPVPGPAALDTDVPSAGGQELLDINMRLTNFSVKRVTGASGLWDVKIGVTYGDQDLMDPFEPPTPGGGRRTCASVTGSEYCALSEQSTTVQRRIR